MNPTPSTTARALAFASLLLAVAAAPAFAKLDVEIWNDRGDDAVYQPGDAMHLKVRTSADAYLLVYELERRATSTCSIRCSAAAATSRARTTSSCPRT